METGTDLIKFAQPTQNTGNKSTFANQQNVNKVKANLKPLISLFKSKKNNIYMIGQSTFEHACTAAGYTTFG